jgi:phosphotriesterase-related protein
MDANPDVDPREKLQIMTVCGPMDFPAGGVVDAHNHTWIEPVPGAVSAGPVLNQKDAILAELQDYRRAGGVGQIDCQPGGCGRNARVQRELSEGSGVFIVAATGFHLPKYYPPAAAVYQMSADQAYEYFLRELQAGMEESSDLEQPVRAGFIKMACQEELDRTPRALLEGAAAACRETGCAVEIHTEKGAAVKEICEFFTAQSVDLNRLVLCHVDKRADFGLHSELARAGVLLEYDTFFRPKYAPEENLWPLLEKMLNAGYSHALALATDFAEAESWKFIGGGPGLAALPLTVRSRLTDMGVRPEDQAKILGMNICRRMARSL